MDERERRLVETLVPAFNAGSRGLTSIMTALISTLVDSEVLSADVVRGMLDRLEGVIRDVDPESFGDEVEKEMTLVLIGRLRQNLSLG